MKRSVGDKPLQPIFLRTPYNYDMNAAGDESGLRCTDPTRTKQSFKEECDINTLVERFAITGEIPAADRVPLPIDVGTGMDFKDAMNQVVAARESFDQLPAKVRARFDNDPARFLDFVHEDDPDNKLQLKKWGLLKPEEPKPPLDTTAPLPDTTLPPKAPQKAPEPPKGGLGDNQKGVT